MCRISSMITTNEAAMIHTIINLLNNKEQVLKTTPSIHFMATKRKKCHASQHKATRQWDEILKMLKVKQKTNKQTTQNSKKLCLYSVGEKKLKNERVE